MFDQSEKEIMRRGQTAWHVCKDCKVLFSLVQARWSWLVDKTEARYPHENSRPDRALEHTKRCSCYIYNKSYNFDNTVLVSIPSLICLVFSLTLWESKWWSHSPSSIVFDYCQIISIYFLPLFYDTPCMLDHELKAWQF